MNHRVRRREFIRQSSMVVAATSLFPRSIFGQKAEKPVRLGFIGVGLRGRNHLHNALAFPEVVIPAICDIDPAAIAASQKLLRGVGRKEAAVYSKNDHDFENMVKRDDLDGVIIATP